MKKKLERDTLLIHEGYNPQEFKGSLTPPIFHTSTFAFATAEEGERRFSGAEDGYIYSRLGNPTVRVLEDRMMMLEKGEGALAFASGMAAVSSVLFHLLKAGDHILCSRGVYGCTFGLLELLEQKFEVTHTFSPLQSEEDVEKGIAPNTACIYIETPINPTMELIDIQMVATIAKKHDIPVVVDNTFCSPYLQNPLELGADFVIHSATKYIGGHGDVIAGIVIGNNKEEIEKIRKTTQKDIGGIISPFDAWLLLRGLKTLHVRMDRHVENAKKVADFLKSHPMVERVIYPGDTENNQYGIMKKQMKAPGGILSFTIKGGKKDAQLFLNSLQIIKTAVSLGDAETLISHPATMTHSVIPPESRWKMGITDNMLRISVGLEAFDDIIDDLQNALEHLKKDRS